MSCVFVIYLWRCVSSLKKAFKLALLVTQHKKRTVLNFPEVRHLPEENLFPTALQQHIPRKRRTGKCAAILQRQELQ